MKSEGFRRRSISAATAILESERTYAMEARPSLAGRRQPRPSRPNPKVRQDAPRCVIRSAGRAEASNRTTIREYVASECEAMGRTILRAPRASKSPVPIDARQIQMQTIALRPGRSLEDHR